MHPSSRRTALAFVVSALLSPCFAADETAIVVSATRFDSDPVETPVGIQVITAEDIRRSSAATLAEVLNKVGGVHTRISFLGTPDVPLDLRGFGATGDQNTLVLLDGQRISENELASPKLSAVPLDAIERIEIVRGGGAVLYGGGATGGTINIITRRASAAAPAASVYAAAGSYGSADLRASGRIAGETSAISLHANHYEADNYRANNRATQDNASGEWRFSQAGDSLAIRAGADRQRARLPGARSEAQLAADPRGTSTPDDFADLDGWRIALAGEHEAGSVTLAADLGYRAKASRLFNQFAGGTFLSDIDTRVVSVSPRLKWTSARAGMANVAIAGLDWSDWDYTNDSTFTFFGFPSPTHETATQRNAAFYVQDHLRVGAATRLAAGWRRERVRISTEESVTPLPRRSRSDPLDAWELSARQDLGGGLGLYGRFGRSFRIANVDENRCFFPPCAGPLLPQKSRDREIGLEYRRAGARARAALFDIALTNELHFNALTFQNVNLSPTRRRGLELEGSVKPGASIELSARYALTDAQFRSGSYAGVDVSGNEVPLVPRHRAGIALGWQAGPATRLDLAVSHVGRQRHDNDQANRFRRMPAYTLADLKVSHRISDLTLAVSIDNLFDRRYYSYAIVDSPTAPTTFSAYPERRRSLMVSAELRFQ